jgi:hypothetical protein
MIIKSEDGRFSPVVIELETRLEIGTILSMIEESDRQGPEFHNLVTENLLKLFGIKEDANYLSGDISRILVKLTDELMFEAEKIK